VNFQDVARAGARVQAVHILRGDGQVRRQLLQIGQRAVAGIGRRFQAGRDAFVVPGPDQRGIGAEAVE